MYTTCPNVAEYQDAMVAWVREDHGAGGRRRFRRQHQHRAAPCYGPKFGKHKHLYDDQNHAYAMLLKRVREVIKRHQPDGALIVNSASPLSIPAEYWKYIDADMLESYICTWVSKERWFDWKTHWHAQGVKLRPYLEAGKQVQALSYLGHTPYGVKEDAFFCYATARLAGFVWNGGLPALPARHGGRSTGFAWASRWATKWRRTASTGGPSRPDWWPSIPTGTRTASSPSSRRFPPRGFYDVFGEPSQPATVGSSTSRRRQASRPRLFRPGVPVCLGD